jgi:hypothetical protein
MAKTANGSMPWLPLWRSFLNNPKVQDVTRVTEALRARYINLLLVACTHESKGCLPGVEETAFMMRLTIEETQKTLDELIIVGLIEHRAKSYWIHDWDDWQLQKSPAAIKQKRYRDKGNALRNGAGNALRNDPVTCNVTPRARSDSDSNSDSQEGVQGEPPPTVTQSDPAVRGIADATEARWPAQNADTFVGDLCQTFDWRLVAVVLDQAYDKDPRKLPRAWIRAGCRNQIAAGWTPETPARANGFHSAEAAKAVAAQTANQSIAAKVKEALEKQGKPDA